jgi:hypothetical protein
MVALALVCAQQFASGDPGVFLAKTQLCSFNMTVV